MRKKLLPIVIVISAFSTQLNAQAGINTSNPTSSLDVTAKNTTGTSTNVDGLLVPRVDRQRAQSMTSVPTSTLIYINDASTGSQTGIASNIDSVGHYFYNGTVWTKLNATSGSPSAVNIYNTDGTLTGNRLVTQGANTLAFGSSIVNGFSVAGNTFSVDGANSRVGIGTNVPTEGKLVIASTASTQPLTIKSPLLDTNQYLQGSITDGSLLNAWGIQNGIEAVFYGSNSASNVSLRTGTLSRLFIEHATGNVAIGSLAPTARLDVNGGARVRVLSPGASTDNIITTDVDGNLRQTPFSTLNSATSAWGLLGNTGTAPATNFIGTTDAQDFVTRTNNTEKMRVTSAGNVGISTASPAASLDIAAKNATGTSTAVDGLLAPRVDRQRAQSMLAVPLSTLIYVNNFATGTQTGTAINIDELGYYYFDGTSWTKLKTPTPAALPTVNIYNTNGTLTSNRTVSQTDKTLAFTGTAVNAFSVDGSTLSVDATNHRIGFGTAAPTGRFEIVSDNVGPGAENDFYFNGYGSSAAPSLFMGSSRGSAAAPTNLANGDTVGGYYFAPRYNGSQIYTNTGILSNYMGDGTTGLTNLIFKASGAQRAIIDENGNMGIGTAAPTQPLHVTGNTRLDGNIYDGSNIAGTAGKVLSSDGSKVIWQTNTGSTPVVFPVLSTAGYSGTAAGLQSLGGTLILPAGKWIVSTNVLIKCTNVPTSVQAVWMSVSWTNTPGGANSPDIIGGTLASGALTGPSAYGMATGNIIINNTSGANKTYYLGQYSRVDYGFTCSLDRAGSSNWGENNIVAYPAN